MGGEGWRRVSGVSPEGGWAGRERSGLQRARAGSAAHWCLERADRTGHQAVQELVDDEAGPPRLCEAIPPGLGLLGHRSSVARLVLECIGRSPRGAPLEAGA